MLDVQTSPGSPVRVRRRLPEDAEGPARDVFEDTYTICPPFKLAQYNDGFEGIPAGCLCVYIAGMRMVRCEDVEPRRGAYRLPDETWGPFFSKDPKWIRMIKAAGHDARRVLEGFKRRNGEN